MERVLERIALSKYKDFVVLKGGFLIASFIGIMNRSTMDLDATIRDYSVSESNIRSMIEDIIVIDTKDDVTFNLIGIKNIREDDEYNGYRIHLEANFERIVQNLKLDFSTGDKITPKAIKYSYNKMFGNEKIDILTYNLETILAEKLETVLSRGVANTRMRDYYDIYVLRILKGEEVDFELFRRAFENTATKRGTIDLLNFSTEVINSIEASQVLHKLWNAYSSNYSYANNIGYNDTVSAIKWLAKGII
ncbi:nucleotidyl transferase AbiEii/AbiGii toxin family protein [Acidaminobacter sp. JC074]|uniref:nucleotidyl transferase AbiEii/AbiGii toxin family protein n=1 Tax=Acidaminobacter sp. JC074 TaxID=2530199 RepID=UPI0021083D3F|nr:nucleotidyl transferase AbiEii/AbiGii toxin family protein [Acidaminobacter sp. JC074]MCH4891115.1 nucleotidyl transferase AbiEii/AbiGii toxin family protein [Acidaminobacter sp. JC074]